MNYEYNAEAINAAYRRSGACPAIVLCASFMGLAFARSLGRRGVPVFALDARPGEVGMNSRHARGIVMPDPTGQAQRWIDLLVSVGRNLDCRPVLFAAGDPHLELMSEGREPLAAFYDFAIPEREVLELLRDKRSQARWFQAHGVDIPRTAMPESAEEAAESAERLGFPCLAKPAVSHLWPRRLESKVVLIESPRRAAEAYRTMTAAGCGCLIQELIRGGDDQFFGALCCFNRQGEALATMTKRKLRQHPEQFGNGSVQVSVDLPELAARSNEILMELGCAGFGSIEYKLDPADGKMKLIEINPRSVSGVQLAIDSGCDFPWIAYRDLAGLPPEGRAGPEEGVLFINEAWELQRVWKTGSVVEWFGYAVTMARARSYAALSLEDPGVAWSLVRRAFRGGRGG